MGAAMLKEWLTMRVEGEALRKLADQAEFKDEEWS
jgi:hypothetical protein